MTHLIVRWVVCPLNFTRMPETPQLKKAKWKPPDLVEKMCEGKDCIKKFVVHLEVQRLCERCRKEKRPYKDPNSPF